MTTRRALLALALAAALAGPGAQAASPQLRDPAGDWVLEGQDIVWGRLSGVLLGGVPHLRAELRLAAPPIEHLQNHYFLSFVHRCNTLRFHAYVGHVDPEPVTAQFERVPYCYAVSDDPRPNASYPVIVSMQGSTVTWIAPYADGMRRGSVLSRFTASAFAVSEGAAIGPVEDIPKIELRGGDMASAPTAVYVAGSDLRRR